MVSTPKARGAGGRADGLLGDVKLVREGGVLIDEVLALGFGESKITLEIIKLVAHALHRAVVLAGGDMPRGTFGGARISRTDGGGEGGVEGSARRRSGRRCWSVPRGVSILPAGADTRRGQVSGRHRGVNGGKGSKVVVLHGELLETLGEVQGAEERRGSGSRSASVNKGGSRTRGRGYGRENSNPTPHGLVRAEGGV